MWPLKVGPIAGLLVWSRLGFGDAPFVLVPKYVFLRFLSYINHRIPSVLNFEEENIKKLLVLMVELAQSHQCLCR